MLDNLLLEGGAIAGIVVGVVLVLLVLAIVGIIAWYISTANKLVALDNNCEEGWSTINVSLKKRYDLIPNLVETVKGYAKHESETLEAVIKARNRAMAATGDGKAEAEKAFGGAIRSLMVLQENYPQLKANEQFTSLSNQLKSIEAEIASARRYYNGVVKAFNNKILMFPSSIVARRKGYEKKKYFELDSEEERQNVKVTF